ARTGPAMTRRKDRYQPRAASASQPKTLKTYACSAIGRDRLTSEKRLSDMVEILAHGLLWLDVLRTIMAPFDILPPFRHRRRIDLLRDRSGRVVSACRLLRRPHPERRETSRPPGAGSDEIRNRAQHQDCQSTRLGSTAECVCPCRRGDRMKHCCTCSRRFMAQSGHLFAL